MAIINEDLGRVRIGSEWFTGIGYQGLLTVNTKTYVKSPTRANDGSIQNINDYDTFVVPRCKLNFKYFSIEDYQRLTNVILSSNEFPVTYFDKFTGTMVTHYMYIEPEEMTKIYNIGTRLIGVLDYEVSFIGTLNHLEEYLVSYNANLSSTDSSTLSSAVIQWGRSAKVKTEDELLSDLQSLGLSVPSGKKFVGWNTRQDGSGFNYLPNASMSVFSALTLYAQWE